MTHAEIYQAIGRLIPRDLLRKYGHLPYAEMAEVPELSQWAAALRNAEDEWERANEREAALS